VGVRPPSITTSQPLAQFGFPVRFTCIERHLLRTREQHCAHVFECAQSTADAERNEDFARYRAHHVDHDSAALIGRRNVVKDQLVGALFVVVARHRDRIADLDIGQKLHALGNFAGPHVEAWDNPFGEHRQAFIRQKLSSILSPTAPLFSR
jgi:hypothetical protein